MPIIVMGEGGGLGGQELAQGMQSGMQMGVQAKRMELYQQELDQEIERQAQLRAEEESLKQLKMQQAGVPTQEQYAQTRQGVDILQGGVNAALGGFGMPGFDLSGVQGPESMAPHISHLLKTGGAPALAAYSNLSLGGQQMMDETLQAQLALESRQKVMTQAVNRLGVVSQEYPDLVDEAMIQNISQSGDVEAVQEFSEMILDEATERRANEVTAAALLRGLDAMEPLAALEVSDDPDDTFLTDMNALRMDLTHTPWEWDPALLNKVLQGAHGRSADFAAILPEMVKGAYAAQERGRAKEQREFSRAQKIAGRAGAGAPDTSSITSFEQLMDSLPDLAQEGVQNALKLFKDYTGGGIEEAEELLSSEKAEKALAQIWMAARGNREAAEGLVTTVAEYFVRMSEEAREAMIARGQERSEAMREEIKEDSEGKAPLKSTGGARGDTARRQTGSQWPVTGEYDK